MIVKYFLNDKLQNNKTLVTFLQLTIATDFLACLTGIYFFMEMSHGESHRAYKKITAYWQSYALF